MTGAVRNGWEALFLRAMAIIDAAAPHAGGALDRWSFGGGTALMLRYGQRLSKDVDIFVPDPQCLGFLSPRLNSVAESMTGAYDEQTTYLKLYFNGADARGEIDFIVSAALTDAPFTSQTVLGRDVLVETPAEILAKKLKYRGDQIKARDLFDLACVLENSPDVANVVRPYYLQHREEIATRVRTLDGALREEFAGLDPLEYTRSYDECVKIVFTALD